MFVGFAAAKGFALMNQSFLRLFLFAVQPQQAFAGFAGGLGQHFDGAFRFGNLRQPRLCLRLQFLHTSRKAARFFAQHSHAVALRCAARLPFGGVGA